MLCYSHMKLMENSPKPTWQTVFHQWFPLSALSAQMYGLKHFQQQLQMLRENTASRLLCQIQPVINFAWFWQLHSANSRDQVSEQDWWKNVQYSWRCVNSCPAEVANLSTPELGQSHQLVGQHGPVKVTSQADWVLRQKADKAPSRTLMVLLSPSPTLSINQSCIY